MKPAARLVVVAAAAMAGPGSLAAQAANGGSPGAERHYRFPCPQDACAMASR